MTHNSTVETARDRIADAVDQCQRNWDRMLNIKTPQDERDKSVINIVYFTSYTVLLEVLRQRDEKFADQLAEWLNDTIESGDGVGERLWEWQREITAGRPLTLPVFGAQADAGDQDRTPTYEEVHVGD